MRLQNFMPYLTYWPVFCIKCEFVTRLYHMSSNKLFFFNLDNVPKPESLSIPIDTIKESKKNQNYFCDSDSDFEELTPVSRKICMENRKSEKIDKIKSSTKKNKDKEKRKNEENKKTVLQKDKNSLSQTIEKPLSQLSSNIEESRKNLVRNKSILLDDDDDDIFLPKKTFLN